ncbi:TonB-dependent receptor domain-containing protein [Rufibacter roseus]|uniref:TonB-dependent receptor domain-containing protein n=1 Tax=Rufibacter roseus TaxID=1567108 RepID=A0ABW2DNK2_9BACT|nr:outer membrane beta-barrel family protein [Rufibacter roseus]
MKKTLLMALAGIIAAQPLFAQGPQNKPEPSKPIMETGTAWVKGKGEIAGVILDETTKTPIEFATVALQDKASGKTVDGTISDAKGKFRLSKIAPGQYKLSISFIGYEAKAVEMLTIEGKEEVNVGVVSLKPDAKQLQEVEVVGEKLLLEDKVDRLVYNAEKDLTNTGGTASDVLKKVPGLTVDLDGNLELRGSTNLRVLINNKPSAIMAASVADALQQIPADLIKSVEVITTPSAKYDAEGTAGIINIITKKNNLQGLNGNVNSTFSNRNIGTNGTIGYKKGKVGLNMALGQSWRNNPLESIRETEYHTLENLDRLSQTMNGRREGQFRMLQLGADYELTEKSFLSAGLRMMAGEFSYQSTLLSTRFADGQLIGANTRRSRNDFDNLNYDLNLDFTRQFAKPGQELTVLGLISRSNRNFINSANVYDRQNQLDFREQSPNEAYNEEKTLQVDYVLPLKNKHLLEVGGKAIWRYAESDYQFLVAQPAGAEFMAVPGQSDVFSYHQNVGAGYASYEFTLNKKFSFKAGVRYEHTSVYGDFTSTQTQVKQQYGNFIPSLAISRKIKENQTIKFNYTKRIQRPQLSYLNPFENRTDTFNIQVGNPHLQAEITDSYEFGYSAFTKSGTSVNATFFWRQTDNSIEPYLVPTAEGVNYQRFGNIGYNASYGLSLSAGAKFLKKGNVNSNLNIFYMDMESRSSELRMANSSMMYSLNMNVSYAFSKGFAAQAFGQYVGSRVMLQGKTQPFTMYNLAVKKDVLQKRGSITLGVDNIFSSSLRQGRTYRTPAFDQAYDQYIFNRQVKLSASYKFGKANGKSQPRRKKKINNDDAKSDDGDNG